MHFFPINSEAIYDSCKILRVSTIFLSYFEATNPGKGQRRRHSLPVRGAGYEPGIEYLFAIRP